MTEVLQDTGKTFWGGSSGRWAGEKLLKALMNGDQLSPQALRTLDTLRKDEWIAFDNALIEEGNIRLNVVKDLIAAGLTIPVANAMGKTILQWENVTDMEEAQTSMTGVVRTMNDTVEFALNNLPLPITHKDFDLNLRRLAASRTSGEPLDTTQARIAGRKVAERLEYMVLNGGPTFGGTPIYGLTNHPNVNVSTFSGGLNWANASKTGAQMQTDVLDMITKLQADRFYGPYWMYIPKNWAQAIEVDFKANGNQSIRTRLLETDGLKGIKVADQLADNVAVMFQATKDVVALVNGEPIQTIQWDIEGGFILKFKVFAIQVPLVRATELDRSGVAVLHA